VRVCVSARMSECLQERERVREEKQLMQGKQNMYVMERKTGRMKGVYLHLRICARKKRERERERERSEMRKWDRKNVETLPS